MDIPQITLRFREGKSPEVQRVLLEALIFLHATGIPLSDKTDRNLERMAMAFLAVGNVKSSEDWDKLKDINSGRVITTRGIIDFYNAAFGEAISSGSYDDIRRKDLLLLVEAGIVVQTSPLSARNDPSRGYALAPEFAIPARLIGTEKWEAVLQVLLARVGTLQERLTTKRQLEMIPVTISSGATLEFSPGEHNLLQKAIIEEFLPRYGYGAEVLYVGDTADKFLHIERERLAELQFFELAHGELPDIVAYSVSKNWLYLIEAVHSSGVISEMRKSKLRQLTQNCTADIIYVTAFLNRAKFREFLPQIAWETEVWIADSPDHLIHFNGDRFLGPY